MRIALFTNNYLPFCGGVTISVETLRRGLEAARPRGVGLRPALSRRRRRRRRASSAIPSLPAATYPEFALAVPWSPRIAPAACGASTSTSSTPTIRSCSGPRRAAWPGGCGRPLVFTYHTRYEKYAHYVPAAARARARRPPSASARASPPRRRRHRALGARSATSCARAASRRRSRWCRPASTSRASGRAIARRARRRARPRRRRPPWCSTSGRLDREKSVDRVLCAFERVAGTVPRARLVLVGPGHRGRARCGDWRERLPPATAIHFLGVRAARGAGRRAIRPPTCSSSPPRRRRRGWCSPRPPRAGCRRSP